MDTTVENPVDTFIKTFKGVDIHTKARATLQLYGSINASLIGLSNSIRRAELRASTTEASYGHAVNEGEKTVDDFNKLVNELAHAREAAINPGLDAPLGMEDRPDPKVTTRFLLGLRAYIIDELNIGPALLASFGGIESTLDYMAHPRTVLEDRVEAIAKYTGGDKDIVRIALQEMYESDARELRNNRSTILDTIENQLQYAPGVFNFDDAPTAIKVRLMNLIKRAFERQRAQAIKRFTRYGHGLDDLALFTASLEKITAWEVAQETTDPDFQLAAMAS